MHEGKTTVSPILKKYWWLITLAIAVLILGLFPDKPSLLEKIVSSHSIASGILSQKSLPSTPATTIPEIRWNKDLTRKGTYLLSTLVDRNAKTFSLAGSHPIFSELIVTRSDSEKWGEQFFFAISNLKTDVAYFQIDRNRTQGVPCDSSGNYCMVDFKVVDGDTIGKNPEEMPCHQSDRHCISRLQIIDGDTITILLNDKEEYTYYRINGMTQVGIRGRYSYSPAYGIREDQNRFTPCNLRRALDSAQLTGSEALMSSLRKQAQQITDRMNKQYWDLSGLLYVEGNAVFNDADRVSERHYRLSKISNTSETIPADCGGGSMAKPLGDFLFPASDPLGSSPFRRATQTEIDALRKRPDWPATLEHCGAAHPSAAFRAYDLSGDGQMDFVFSSFCGGNEHRNYVWVHHGNSLRYVGPMEGTIRYFFDRRPGTFAVLVNRGWCCASFTGRAEVFRFDGDAFRLTRTASVLEISGIAVPTEKMPPTTFIVAKEGAALREGPRVDDAPFTGNGAWDHPGNIIAAVKSGTKGKAVGKQKGSNGELWWFVVLDPSAVLVVDHVSWEKENATSRSGWMNVNDLSSQ